MSADELPGEDRVIERVGLGCWVYSYDGDTGRWGRVTAVLSLTHTSGRKATELRIVDDAAGEAWGIRDWNNEPIRCCSKAQAKKAGLALGVSR